MDVRASESWEILEGNLNNHLLSIIVYRRIWMSSKMKQKTRGNKTEKKGAARDMAISNG